MSVSTQTILTSMMVLGALATSGVSAQTPDADPAVPTTPQTPFLFIDPPVPFDPASDEQPAPPPAVDPADDPAFIERMDAIREYGQTVETIEYNGGAWDDQLTEQLISLGNLHQEQGDHVAAVEIFDRAMHINRINSGLHTLQQVPVLERLIESYLALGDWEKADLYYNYMFYVQQRAYGSNDPRIIPVLDALASWNVQAFNLGVGESLGLRLSTAQILYSAAARMVSVHFGKSDERFVNLQKSVASSAYLVSRNPELMAEMNRPEYRTTQAMLRDKLNESRSGSIHGYSAGEHALLEIVNFLSTQPDSERELAEALANLGDWYLIFERRRGAAQYYRAAWNVLGELEDGPDLQQAMFGSVAPIPRFAASPDYLIESVANSAGEASSLHYDFADLVLDVTANGIVRNVRVVSEETDANANQLDRLKRAVRRTYFRPVLVDAEPVETEDNHFRYRYWY